LNRDPIGTIIESKLDRGKGVVSTVIVQNGTLYPRDFIVAGGQYGNIRSLTTVEGKPLDKAFPGMPCIITGLNKNPLAGDKFIVLNDEKFAKKMAEEKQYLDKQKELSEKNSIIVKDGIKTINIIIKTDVQGTAEAIKNSISKIKNDEVIINVIRSGAGEINKADIILAEASNARIYAFNNEGLNSDVKKMAESKNVKIIKHNIIYKIIEELSLLIKTLKEPVYEEKLIGEAIVIQLFYYSKVGTIASGTDGKGELGNLVLDRYKLVETKAPDNYLPLKDPVYVEEKDFDKNSRIALKTIENKLYRGVFYEYDS